MTSFNIHLGFIKVVFFEKYFHAMLASNVVFQ